MEKFAVLQAGVSIPERVWIPTDMQLRQYAEASGDYNPIHLDEKYAQQLGLGGVIAHGMHTMAQVGAMLTQWLNGEGSISQFEVRFQNMVRPGDTIHCTGVIKEKLANAVVCDVKAVNQHDAEVISGSAVITFKA